MECFYFIFSEIVKIFFWKQTPSCFISRISMCASSVVSKVYCLTHFCNPENVKKHSVFRRFQGVQKWNIGLKWANEGKTFFKLVKPERGRGWYCHTFLLIYGCKIFVYSHTYAQNRFKVANSDTATVQLFIYLSYLTLLFVILE